MSGSIFAPWALVQRPSESALELAKYANCSIPDNAIDVQDVVVECLKKIPLKKLMAFTMKIPKYLHMFGPSIDGVTITSDFITNPERVKKQLEEYNVMFGVNSGEALFQFGDHLVNFGFDEEYRDKIFRTYVRNVYSFHPREIFAAVVNEYTDWDKPLHHPVNVRDATINALSDCQYVAPLFRFVQLMDLTIGDTFFYVFSHQTKDSKYPPVSIFLFFPYIFLKNK